MARLSRRAANVRQMVLQPGRTSSAQKARARTTTTDNLSLDLYTCGGSVSDYRQPYNRTGQDRTAYGMQCNTKSCNILSTFSDLFHYC